MMLSGRVLLILGSSRGIGAATATLATEYGARVILHGRTSSGPLAEMAARLGCPIVFGDVRDAEEFGAALADACQIYERIDILVNCFGVTNQHSRFLEQGDDEWLDTLQVNLLGTVRACREILPVMLSQGYGRIVNVTSIRAFPDSTGRAAYSAAKGAVNTLTAALSREFAPDVLINAVAPSFVTTDMAAKWSDRARSQVGKALLARAASPEEVAEVICFLVSDGARFMTGQIVSVDGGYRVAPR